MSIRVIDLGLIEFLKAHKIQKHLVDELKSNGWHDTLIICEHPPTITLGRKTRLENLLADEKTLKERKISVFRADRGGDVTYHGPGQIIAYPIFDLRRYKKDIHWFLRKLEEITIDFLWRYKISGERKKGFTGVWVGNKKIVSIGIGISNWITFHGLAINVKTNLEYFSLIKPCGLKVEMTSMEAISGKNYNLTEVKPVLLRTIEQGFNHRFTNSLQK
ncbi:MAG: lipoyl(octanoyl) transferase LipB [Candidatus Omnitrophota bacterium]